MKDFIVFFNRCFDKKRLKNFILWFFNQYGAYEATLLIENLKKIGFEYATKTGVSLGIDDLKVPLIKAKNIYNTEEKVQQIEINYSKGNITEIERKQQLIEEWNFSSEKLKISVVQFFKATNLFNPIYMIAFSGARGNISQVRQLIGMRGLMVDPKGQVLEFPIRSNFREGLNLTEYIISCYGARKGVVDTALRTATSGYLTRRLVDVTQQVIIGKQDCKTTHGIECTSLMDGRKKILSMKDRIIGRILLNDCFDIHPVTKLKTKIASKNQEISSRLSQKISRSKKSIILRSPLSCRSKNFICQLCYGWSLAHNTLVSIGEAVGILAAQSIGEPGTQLTMRTFHTGGVFTGGFIDQIYAPFNGKVEYLDSLCGTLIRTLNGQIGFLSKTKACLKVQRDSIFDSEFTKKEFTKLSLISQLKPNFVNDKKNLLIFSKIYEIESKLYFTKNSSNSFLIFNTPIYTTFLIRNNFPVQEKTLIAQLSSPSFFENQQQETEQQIFSPNSGQIYFEDLVLIEKMNREGIVQNLTSGLGSIWLINGDILNCFNNQKIFPIHGDLLGLKSIVQKIKILLDKNYDIDFHLFSLFKKFEFFKKQHFSLTKKISVFKFEFLDDLFLNKLLFCINLKKVYYLKSQYFILFNLNILKLNLSLYSNIKFLSFSFHKHQLKCFQNEDQLSLNFNFIPNKKIHYKLNYLIYSELKLKLNKSFFYEMFVFEGIKSKLKYPIFSRKYKILNNKNRIINMPYWSNFHETNISKKKYSSFRFSSYYYYFKIVNKDSINFELPLNIQNFSFKLNNQLIFIKSDRIKILKDFLSIFNTKNFSIIYTNKFQYPFFKKLKLITPFQTFFILTNFQGLTKFQLLNSYKILDNFKIQNLCLVNCYKKSIINIPDLFIFKKNILKKNILKPTFFNLNFINKIDGIKNYLYDFIINYFVYLYNQKNDFYLLSNVQRIYYKKDNLKIGFKVLFRTNIIFYFKGQQNLDKQISFKNFQINKQIFEKIPNLILHFENQIESKFKIRQTFQSWICCPSNFLLLKNLNKIIKMGSFIPGNIRFDHHQILIDIIPLKINYFFKDYLKNQLNFKWINNKKSRFLKKAKIISKLILFEKIQINQESNFKSKFLNHFISNQIFLKLLKFNCNQYFYNRFHKIYFKSTKSINLFNFNNQIPKSERKIFLKTQYLKNIIITFSLKFGYYTFLNNYFPIYQKYIFKNRKNNIKYQLFKNYNKKLNFSIIRKFNFKEFNNNRIQKQNLLKIFVLSFESFYFNSFIYIEFFINFKSAEIIQTEKIYQKTNSNFILLNQSNLKEFYLNKTFLKKFTIGEFLRYATNIQNKEVINESGQIIYIDKFKIIIRKATPFLITSRSVLNVYQNEIVNKNSRLFKFLYHKIKTGDIIQGIPKIEEFFEARITRSNLSLLTNLHLQLKTLFSQYSLKFSIYEATQKSFEIIQKIIIDEIQKIYCSQGVFIADQHLEIVVRQMTSKVKIKDGGRTGLLFGELIEFDWAELINLKLNRQEVTYEPIVLGITKSSLETESFISAASFQETTRILTKAAVQNKIDFVRGLKQNIILGRLIPAGTGFFYSMDFLKSHKD